MLRISKLTDAEYVLRDVAGGLEDYYLGLGEAPGVWFGGLAEELGARGVVEAEWLRALIDARDPTTGTGLFPPDRRERTVMAIDVTLAPPKSVSLLWAFATPETSSAVSIAHVEAVMAALELLEDRAAVTRQQTAGVRCQVPTSGLAVATFVHRTSREGDPHLHSHCVIPNLVHRPDGSYVAIDAAGLYRWAKAAGSIYQEELRRRLAARLGVGWGPDRNGTREMLGFTEAQLERFSKRTGQIHERLEASGVEPRDAKERMWADEAASLATRRPKDRSLTPERLRNRWKAEAARVGLKTGRKLERKLAEAGRGQPRQFRRDDVEALFSRLVDPELGLCAEESSFTEAQVVQHIAAFGAGQTTSAQIQQAAHLFLQSSPVVRLMDRDASGRTPPRWSTRAHRGAEDRVLDHVSALQHRLSVPIDGTTVYQTLADYPQLGVDQAGAVRTLAGPGAALRALIAPAGHGKTTTLVAAADAAQRSGRPVIAVATTNQAATELRRAGLDASTVARFALDGCRLPAGSVLIVDELSQLPTVEADIVLSAAARCDAGQLWLVGDPLQSRPVRAGGLAPHIAELAGWGRIPSATLTVNRRQRQDVERQALDHYRHGAIADSQTLRQQAGLEHEAANPVAARQAMAEALVDALSRHGCENVVALAVTHADCEGVADRIRVVLAQQGAIRGPAIEGPGWDSRRVYQAGDRIVLHSHLDLEDGRRQRNGTVGSVVSVTSAGLTLRADGDQQTVSIPSEFIAGRRPDGRPRISHAWCRTIDGVQGGTWSEAHLLATAGLDRHRGYVGQSRASFATHTWNTRAVDPGDHGGRLARNADTPADEVQGAMERHSPKTFAAFDDPYRQAERLTRERDAHRAVLACRPPDRTAQLEDAREALQRARQALKKAEQLVAGSRDELNMHGALSRFLPRSRHQRADAERHARSEEQTLTDCQELVEQHRHQLAQVELQQQAGRDFDRTEGWRQGRVGELDQQLGKHWTAVVLAAARAGDPYAYGNDRLEEAHRTLLDQGRTSPNDELVKRNLGDLERAALTFRQVAKAEPALVPNAASTRHRGQWPDLSREYYLERHLGREAGVGL
jgi:conjugative relaxase-like TrwC/TraI family protein